MKGQMTITQFERFQVEIMGNKDAQKKCRICEHGHDYGPRFKDGPCHKCGIERRENAGT